MPKKINTKSKVTTSTARYCKNKALSTAAKAPVDLKAINFYAFSNPK